MIFIDRTIPRWALSVGIYDHLSPCTVTTLPQAVLLFRFNFPHLSFKLVFNENVQIAMILRVLGACHSACDGVTLRDHQHFVQIEYSLLPMCVRVFRTGREVDNLVTLREPNVEMAYKCVNIIVSFNIQLEILLEHNIFFLDDRYIHSVQFMVVSHNC